MYETENLRVTTLTTAPSTTVRQDRPQHKEMVRKARLRRIRCCRSCVAQRGPARWCGAAPYRGPLHASSYRYLPTYIHVHGTAGTAPVAVPTSQDSTTSSSKLLQDFV